jgi:hypothetical protein
MVLETAIKEIATKTVSDLLGIHHEPRTEVIAASLRETRLRIETVSVITGLSTPTIYREMARGQFPRPLRITSHARA